jgi:hypothetical protein
MPTLKSLRSEVIDRKFVQESSTFIDGISVLIKRFIKGNLSIVFPSAK